MASQALRSGVSIAGEAIRNTERGERALYGLLAGGGAALVVVGWRADSSGWTTAHPYLVGLLIGATGFCFGVPVAGIVIREITRRASQSAERRIAARAITSQLDYLDRLVEGLSPGPTQSASDRLRKLASTAWSAMPQASVSARKAEASGKVGIGPISVNSRVGSLALRPKIEQVAVTELRGVVESNNLWASIGFSCGRLSGDIARLVSVLYPKAESQRAFPEWLDELTSALQTLIVIQLPPQRLWLVEAAKDTPTAIPFAIWSWRDSLPSERGAKFLGVRASVKEESYSMTPDGQSAAQERATNELRGELFALGHHLEALAAVVDAAGKCRNELKS